ncbi:hypothetical protein [Alkaliphilus hydrothermalis]|uniref:Uncharacterized coiled-coil DUF342 family protein n=1 Tax=Alkaliphilus hydrothermalis TaxID=1482730 RepID=A0ABS2NQ31_9FIRM|nr:hypothetical protein [Alkaliphilus hydrothermalis]MBM7615059.1 uncharacterized coiled-coil DUF342 family protein [Alkaliphilus hydrothermalis]
MKKIVAMVLMVCVLVVGGGNTFAFQGEEEIFLGEDMESIEREGQLPEVKENKRFNTLKEFRNELQQLNQLKIQALELRTEAAEKHGTILDLYIEARENQMMEELQEAKEVRQTIKGVNNEIAQYKEEMKESMKSFRQAVKNDEIEVARQHINNAITLKSLVNSKISAKLLLLDEIIEILS